MPNSEEVIEITDFRPGMMSDMFSAPQQANQLSQPADPTDAFMGQNGAATVENTYACRADRTGALIPLPRAFQSGVQIQGIPTNTYTTAVRPATFPTAYLLDAEVSPQRFYQSGIGVPFESTVNELSSVYTLWGFWYAPAADGVANGYWQFVLGREYRINSPFITADIYDFIFSRSDIRFGPVHTFFNLPTGSLCLSRLDNGANPTVVASLGALFSVKATTPVIVGLVSFNFNNNPYGTNMMTGAIPANENTWLSNHVIAAGAPATAKRPSIYSPTIVAAGVIGHIGNVVVGMSLGTDGYDIGAAHGVDEWSFHTKDDSEVVFGANAPYVPYMIVPHQGRIVMPDLIGVRDYAAGLENDPAAADVWSMYFSDDILWYSNWGQPIGDVYTITAVEYFRGWKPLQVAEDQVAKVGVIGVVTGDELLIVKARGGGALIRGDLENPTVRRLPHIEPTHGVSSKGAQTPIGFVYGTKTGVFAFDGGDATKKLSPQLDGFFWNPYVNDDESISLEGSYGRFAYWNGMVMVPNNFVYDTETDSWWRLYPVEFDLGNFGLTAAYNIYNVNNVGQLWAFPHKVITGTTTDRPLFHSYNIDRLAGEYSWQSQPLVETKGRQTSFQDVRLLVSASDAAVISVTLTGYDETGGDPTTITTVLTCDASDKPQIMRADISPNFTAEYVQVRITAVAGTFATQNAPKIHALRLGIKARRSTIRHS